MSVTYHITPREYEVQLTRFGHQEPYKTEDGVYTITFRFNPEAQKDSHYAIFIPEPLRAEVEAGNVKSFWLEENLKPVVSMNLPYDSLNALWGIRTRDDEVITSVPFRLARTTKLLKYGGGLATFFGIGLLWTSHAAIAALLLVAGTHALRTLLAMPDESEVRYNLNRPA